MVGYRYVGPAIPAGTHRAKLLFILLKYQGDECLGYVNYVTGVRGGD
jgi:hypothetical protein